MPSLPAPSSTLLEELLADPSLTVRMTAFGPPCLRKVKADGETHLRTLPMDALRPLIASGDVVMVAEGERMAWRDFAPPAAERPAAEPAAEQPADASRPTPAESLPPAEAPAHSPTGPSPARPTDMAAPTATRSCRLPAIGSVISQNTLLAYLDTYAKAPLAQRVIEAANWHYRIPGTPQSGKLIAVDAALVTAIEAEGYSVEIEAAGLMGRSADQPRESAPVELPVEPPADDKNEPVSADSADEADASAPAAEDAPQDAPTETIERVESVATSTAADDAGGDGQISPEPALAVVSAETSGGAQTDEDLAEAVATEAAPGTVATLTLADLPGALDDLRRLVLRRVEADLVADEHAARSIASEALALSCEIEGALSTARAAVEAARRHIEA